VATPLALVLTELLQNCVEHAFPLCNGAPADARVRVAFERGPVTLRVLVADNGVGLPAGQSLESVANLGLQIARTLVESELGGTMSTLPRAPADPLEGSPHGGSHGMTVELLFPLP
jgi:two-component sensor histidine kinase